jgi:hypothetical protein
MKKSHLLCGVLLSAMSAGGGAMAAGQNVVTPVIPSDSAARPRSPEAQAVLDASTVELVREMKAQGITALRIPKNAVIPGRPDFANYDEAKANPYPNLPPLMMLRDGTKVTTPAGWAKRREEITALFDTQVYGKYPAHLPKVTWTVTSTTQQEVEGIPAIVKHVVGHVDNSAYPAIGVEIAADVVTPVSARGKKVPVIIGGGSLRPRPMPLAPPTRATTGMCMLSGPVVDSSGKQLLEKGWGFVSIDNNAVQADNGAGLTKGIIGLVNKGQPRSMDDWGVLRAWAWGASRTMDYLLTDPDVDGSKVGVMGHSRGGKAALVALVDDPRFAIGFISSSGAGGANLYRRNYGEALENVAAPNEFHWMAGNFLKYAAVGHSADEMPVDAHEFVALVAPRPIFIGGGGLIMDPPCAIPGDAWQDAQGMFLSAVAASPAWEVLGRKGIGTSTFPKVETLIDTGEVAFRQHPWGHTPNPNWQYFIQFAQRELK